MYKKRIKTKIRVDSFVKAKVGDMEEKKRQEITTMMRKEVVVCVQDVVGKKKFLVQFKVRQNKDISYFSLTYVCSKQYVCLDMDDPISDLPQKKQGGFLTIDGYPDVEKP